MRRSIAALILIASLLSFLMACPILAGPIEDSIKAYRRGDYKTAYQLIKPQAEKGDDVAQFVLGFMYDEGKGVPQDYAEAAKWYSMAAKQGNKAAQHNLGLIDDQGQVSKDRAEMQKWHRRAAGPETATQSNPDLMDDQNQVSKDQAGMEKWHRSAAGPETAAQSNLGPMDNQGRGVARNYAEAAKWYRKAAEQGFVVAQYKLGDMYLDGQGVPQDYDEALKWYRKSADQGEEAAQYQLGLMYAKGQGVPQDYVLAHMWSNLATSRYPASEKEDREQAVRNRDRVSSMMTPAQFAEAQRLAREWKPKMER